MKINKMITTEPEVWDRFQRMFPGQASAFCTEAMRKRIALAEGDVSSVDLELLKEQRKEVQNTLDTFQENLQRLNHEITQVEKRIQEEEQEKLKKEKEKLEAEANKQKCQNCHKEIEAPIDLKGTGKKYQLCVMCLHTMRRSPQLPDYEVKDEDDSRDL